MSSLNEVNLIGNVGKDPEVKTLNNGTTIASFSVATTEKWTNKQSGERNEKTEWHRVVIFHDAMADIVRKYVRKGSKIFVRGSLRTRKFTDSAGVEKFSTEVVLNGFDGKIVLLGDPAGERAAPAQRANDLDDEAPF